MTNESMWTTEQLAKAINVASRTVQQWCKDERIIARRYGSEYRIPEDEAQRVIAEGVPPRKRQ